jgi:hypothetical protein
LAASDGAALAPEAPLLSFQIPNLERDWPSIARLLPSEGNWATLKQLQFSQLLPIMSGPALARLLNLSQRTEVGAFAPSIESKEQDMVVAVLLKGGRSSQADLEEDFTLIPSEAGALRLAPRSGLNAALITDQSTCELWSLGDASVLTCGSVRGYTPSRGIGMAKRVLSTSHVDPQDTVSIEMPSSLFVDAVKSESHASDAAERFGEELVIGAFQDLRLGRFGLALSGQESAGNIELEFASRKSLLTSVVVDGQAVMRPDEIFFRLPSTLDFAAQFAGMPRKHRRAEVLEAFQTLVQLAVDSHEVRAEGLEPLSQVFAQLFLTGGPSIFATGMDSQAYHNALNAFLSKPTPTGDDLVALRRSAQEWTLVGLKEDSTRWIKDFKAMHELDVKFSSINPPGQSAAVGPVSGSRKAPVPSVPGQPSRIVNRIEATPSGAPPNTVHYTLETVVNPEFANRPSRGGLPPAPITHHVLIHGLGEYTWLCVSIDTSLCIRHLKGLRNGGSTTIEQHPRRAELAQTNGKIVGLTSLVGFSQLVLQENSVRELQESQKKIQTYLALPPAGRSPLLFTGQVTQLEDGSARLRVEAKLEAPEILAIASMMDD